jgi:hypothetical protein
VHASRRWPTKTNFEDFLAETQALGIQRYPKSIDDFVFGAIVGSAVIEKVVRGSKSFWAVRGSHHGVLGRPRRGAPQQRPGQLGFFKVKGGR